MRVYLGSDHAGFELKAALIKWLGEAGHQAVDCGPASYQPQDDYPVYVMRAASAVAADPDSLGIVIGGSGNGEAIAANKIRGIRAAIAWTQETARLARLHNDANVLSLGARMYPVPDAVGFAQVFVETAFSGEPRHARRLEMIAEYEKTGELPANRQLTPNGPGPSAGTGAAPAASAPRRARLRILLPQRQLPGDLPAPRRRCGGRRVPGPGWPGPVLAVGLAARGRGWSTARRRPAAPARWWPRLGRRRQARRRRPARPPRAPAAAGTRPWPAWPNSA